MRMRARSGCTENIIFLLGIFNNFELRECLIKHCYINDSDWSPSRILNTLLFEKLFSRTTAFSLRVPGRWDVRRIAPLKRRRCASSSATESGGRAQSRRTLSLRSGNAGCHRRREEKGKWGLSTLAACKLSNSEICNDSKHCQGADKRRNERCTN